MPLDPQEFSQELEGLEGEDVFEHDTIGVVSWHNDIVDPFPGTTPQWYEVEFTKDGFLLDEHFHLNLEEIIKLIHGYAPRTLILHGVDMKTTKLIRNEDHVYLCEDPEDEFGEWDFFISELNAE